MPPTVACLHHLDEPFLGTVQRPLRDAGLVIDERMLQTGDALPAPGEVDAIVSLGGAQSARAAGADPVLRAELELLRAAVEGGVPVLGVCLGAQLLAVALGGRVRRAERRTVAWVPLEALPAAAADPVFGRLPPRVAALHWNDDVFDLPQGAVELLRGATDGVAAFRAGPAAWGVQFHPDVDAHALDRWYARYGAWLSEAGVCEVGARRADARYLTGQMRYAERLFGAFADVVRARAVSPAPAAARAGARPAPVRPAP